MYKFKKRTKELLKLSLRKELRNLSWQSRIGWKIIAVLRVGDVLPAITHYCKAFVVFQGGTIEIRVAFNVNSLCGFKLFDQIIIFEK